MKALAETIGSAFFIALLFAMAFVFQGDPDLWDKWHERAMQETECNAGQTTTVRGED